MMTATFVDKCVSISSSYLFACLFSFMRTLHLYHAVLQQPQQQQAQGLLHVIAVEEIEKH